MYSSRLIEIEVMEPAKVVIPGEYKTVAVRYNNCNVAPHSTYQNSLLNGKLVPDESNLDSIASIIYFNYFLDQVQKQKFFDSLIVLDKGRFSNIVVKDSLTYQLEGDIDSLFTIEQKRQQLGVRLLSNSIKKYPNKNEIQGDTLFLHDKFGLYKPEDIKAIADTTGADMLISLDFFSSIDGINFYEKSSYANEAVGITGLWNFYDLKEPALKFFYKKEDTITWDATVLNASQLDEKLPPRRDAVLNAADIAGSGFANFLVPHWSSVKRMYYASGHVELKETEKMVNENRWMDAAEVWKSNVDNPNKRIVAKCMYNLAVACEMKGDLEAAMDWVVRSYHMLENKNEVHEANCTQYIRILAQRKIDYRKLENQFTSEINYF